MGKSLKIFARITLAALLIGVAGCGGGSGSSSGGGFSGAAASASSSASSSAASTSSAPAVADVPELNLTTDGGAAITSKDDYITGAFSLAATDNSPAVSGTMSIKLHGNSTLGFPKLPYRIKLDDKAGLLGMPKDKNWVLLANYSDKSLLRNRTALELSRRLGMAWTPRAYPVEVTLNGQYVGVYDLVEQIRIDKNRVNITEFDDDNSGAPDSGGYLMEINDRMDDPVCWQTHGTVPVCIKDPDPSTPAQQAYIENYVQAAEDAVSSSHAADPDTGYANYIDVDSLIDWYLVNELFKNLDSAFVTSVYMYKDAGGKLTFGPVWDFDLGAGNTDFFDPSPEGFRTADGLWIERMKQNDPAFEARIRARWDTIKATELDTLPDWIDQQAAPLQTAQARNFARWPILDQYVWPNSEIAGSYQGEVDFFHNWMVQRIAWLDANL